jgi:beta-glucanase (GH16 family)
MNKLTRLLTTAALALVCQGLSAAEVRTAPNVTKAAFREGPPAGKQWKLVWNDEFDGKEIDLGRWAHGSASPYTPPENDPNTRLDGEGHLVCTFSLDNAGKPVLGGIHSRSFEKAYGYFETRVQFSTQPGWWGAVWLQGRTWFHQEGSDTFLFPQEFDMFEDFYKPKRNPDISHCYHAVAGLSTTVDQGDGKGIGGGGMINRKEVCRVSSGRQALLEEYGGWHTVGFEWTPLEHIWYVDGQETLRQSYRDVPVTSVPQIVKIGGVFTTPRKSKQAGGQEPFYGWLEDAKLPDQLKVDYFRVYDEDHAGKKPPQLTVTLENAEAGTRQGQPATFRIQAGDQDGTVKTIYLFSKGHIRAEVAVDAATADQRITVSNLFPGRNTVIAMAKDNDGLVGLSAPLRVDVLSGREYTGTAYQGKPQQIPGTILPGHYDEGGNGAAFYQEAGLPVKAAYTWRIGEMKNAMADRITVGQVDCGVPWVTYQVEVRETGWYDVELLMSRSDYCKNKFVDLLRGVSEPIRLEVDRAKAAEWKLDAQWDSGTGWNPPAKPVGKQRVRLEKGPHQLVMRFDEVMNTTAFGGLVFTLAE